MTAYYNEFDKGAAAWLRELIKAGLIAAGDVDERSIVDADLSSRVERLRADVCKSRDLPPRCKRCGYERARCFDCAVIAEPLGRVVDGDFEEGSEAA